MSYVLRFHHHLRLAEIFMACFSCGSVHGRASHNAQTTVSLIRHFRPGIIERLLVERGCGARSLAPLVVVVVSR
jgi:DNA-directed RNA polymerase subunit N (RpoN/RPB10)